jgi:5-methylcytosine-specific restriction endonuclease McrA
MSREYAYALYHSKAWQHIREQALERDHRLCQRCLKQGRVTPAVIVHHIVHVSPANVSDPKVTLNLDNLTCLCRECHAIVHGFDHTSTREDVTFDADGNLVPRNYS